MQKINFDTGIKEYEINENGILRFNPSDPNVYHRFMEMSEEVLKLEQQLMGEGPPEGEKEEQAIWLLQKMNQIDRQVKNKLSYVFGAENDFDRLLGGVNLMAVGANGERIVTNLFEALYPLIAEGAKKHSDQLTTEAVEKAKLNRAQRRAIR